MPLRRVRDGYWVCNTRAEIESQFGSGLDFKTGDALTIIGGDASGGWIWDTASTATPGAGVIQVSGETGRFILSSATSSSGLVTSSGSGTSTSFPSSQRRIFHSDGTTAGGSWAALTETDISNAIGDGTIEADKVKPSATNNQVLRTVGGITVWSNETVTTLIPLVSNDEEGSVVNYPVGQQRIFHSDGSTDGGSWSALNSSAVNGAFENGSIAVGKLSTTGSSTGQVIKNVSGTVQWADDEVDVSVPLVTSGAAGASNSFPSGQVRLFQSDGTTAGGSWAQLTSTEVGAAFANASIAPTKLTPGSNGQVLAVVSGIPGWANLPTPSFVTSSVGGQVNSFPASQTRIFWSNGSTGGGSWAQLTSTEVGAAFAASSIALTKLVPAGTNGYQLTTSGGVATWTAPEFTISGATNGDLIRRASGAWARLPLLNTPNAPLLSISGLPEWSPLHTAPTVNLGSGTVSGVTVNMSTHGDNRLVYLDANAAVDLVSINEVGFRQGQYLFVNVSDFNISVQPDSGTLNAGFILPTGNELVLEPAHAMLANYYGDGSLRDFYVTQVFDSDGLSELLIGGSVGEILAHDGARWVRIPPAAATDYKLMSGGPSALPSWVQDDDGATVILRPGYSGSDRNIFGTWTAAFNAAKAHGGPSRLLVEFSGTSIGIPAGTWDGDGRVGIYFSRRSSTANLTAATNAEIKNITAWENVSPWPFTNFEIVVTASGTSTNSCVIYQDNAGGTTLKYSGRFTWVGTRDAIKTVADSPIHMRELQHVGTMGIRSSGDLNIITEHRVVPPPCTSDSGTATLTVRHLIGTSLEGETFGWTGSGGVTFEKPDNVASTNYMPETAFNWPEGAPDDPKDALDKLAARAPGAMPPGANLVHGHWLAFGKNTGSSNFIMNTEGATLWVPGYNHWLCFGYQVDTSDTDNRQLYCLSSIRGVRNLTHQGWWTFDANPGGLVSSNFKRPLAVAVIPNGGAPRVVVSSQLVSSSAQCVATSDNGGATWTMRNGHFGSGLNGYRSFAWSGTHLIGIASATTSSIGRSSDGVTWSSVTVSSGTRVKLVSDGNGVVLAIGTSGSVDRSTNHGSSFTSSSISGFGTLHDAIYFDQKFIVMSTAGSVYTSVDGATWSSASSIVISHPGKTGFVPFGFSYRSLVKCGGVLFGLFKGVYDNFADGMTSIFYSHDGITWHDSGVLNGYYDSSTNTEGERFAIHLSSTSMNAGTSQSTDVHQIVGRITGAQFDDFDTGNEWFISPAALSSMVY